MRGLSAPALRSSSPGSSESAWPVRPSGERLINPARDQFAIVGLGTREYSRASNGRSAASLAVEACHTAVSDAGLGTGDIDGVVGTIVPTKQLQTSLGLPSVTCGPTVTPSFGFHSSAP